MKRRFSVLLAFMAAMVLIGALCGCQQLGIGAPHSMPQKKTTQVSTPALAQEGILRVGVNAQNAPFSTEVDGRMVGIDIDMAAALATELGVSVECVDVGADGEKALANGTVDVIMGMEVTDTAASCWLSDPYLETAVALFATSNGAIMPTSDSKPSIEAQESSLSAWEVNNQFGKDSLKSVRDLKTAFEDLSGGNTMFVASDVVIGSYINRTTGSNAQIIGLLQTPSGYCVGVPAANNDLKMAIANAVDAIENNGVADVVQKKWIGAALDLDSYSLSDAASKAAGVDRKKDKLSDVGSNAVDPTQGQTGETQDASAAAVGEGDYTYYSYEEDTGGGGGGTAYYDNSPVADTGGSGGGGNDYVADEAPADTGGGEDYTADTGGDSGAEEYVDDGGGDADVDYSGDEDSDE